MRCALALLAIVIIAAEPTDIPRVKALVVTHLGFTDKDSVKIADTAIKLLESCSSSCSSKEKDFESIFKQCHW